MEMFIAPGGRRRRAFRASMDKSVNGGPQLLQQFIALFFAGLAANDRKWVGRALARAGAKFAQEQIAMIKSFSPGWDEQVGHIALTNRLDQHCSRYFHAEMA